MLKDFLNTKYQEIAPKIYRMFESNEQKYKDVKNNILELIFGRTNSNTQKKVKKKSHSQPNCKYRRKNLRKKESKQEKKEETEEDEEEEKEEKIEEEENDNSINLNLSIKEDEKPINLEDLVQQKNKELQEKELINKDKEKDKLNNKKLNTNKRMSKDSNDLLDKKIGSNNGLLLNINDKYSNNDILNINNKYSSNEFSSNNNSNKNFNLLVYKSNSNTNKSNTNYAFNFFGVNNQEDNSSLNSSKNESPKNNQINKNNQNRVSNLSTSSFGKNFILKSEICKSTFHNENKYHKNNNSEDNPIMSYFSKDIKDKTFGNFYLFTDRKSVEEPEQNQYINFFPVDEDNNKKKEKNIMSCNYIDINNENTETEKINSDIISENDEYSSKYNFKLNDFHQRSNKEDKLNLEKIIKNLDDDTINNNDDKYKIDKILECDEIDDKINNFIDKEKNNQDNNNINDKNISNQDNNKFDFPINKNINNGTNNNNINNFYNNGNNFNSNPNSLSYVNNIYNSNINNYKQFQMNPMINQGMPNYFFNQNMNVNPIMNYFNQNFPQFNYYQLLYNQTNNQFQKPYFSPLNSQSNINSNNINSNNININNNIETNKFNSNRNNNIMETNQIINNNIKDNNSKINNINNEPKNNNINRSIYNNNIYNINNNINNNNNLSTINNSFFQKKNFYEYSDEEILNFSVQIINDQMGCRFMQDKIRNNHNFANELLFPKIKYNLKDVCCDNYGNYFLQALIDILSFDNINKFFDMTQNVFTDICISPHGTRVIQKIIDKISATPILLNRFIYNLNSKDLGIIFKSPYGNHMIQKFLQTIHSSEYSNFIFFYVYKNFLDIADSKHGVCVIQKCVSEGDEKQRAKLYELILNNFNNLIKDQYGNYLIQYILINTKTEDKFREILPIIIKIEENIVDFCKSKYSANVIEKSFENCENMISEHILDSILENYNPYITEILLDQYGIYVIQKALKIKNILYKQRLIDTIYSKEKEIKSVNFGDYKYKNILKIINSNKELGDIFGKFIKLNPNNISNEKINSENNNNDFNNSNFIKKGEDNRNDFYNYNNNNRGKNKKGRKNNRGNNNRY